MSHDMRSDDFGPLEYPVVATMQLSGTHVRVGFTTDRNPAEQAVWIDSDEQGEPIYISPSEARVLITVLELAIERTKE